MRAMILAAGVGSRLGSLTEFKPKCLVPLYDGTCMLDRVVGKLFNTGITEAVINLYHCGDQIKDHVAKSNYPLTISFSEERTLLGTGGGLKYAKDFFLRGESFLLYNSDIYYEGDLSQLIALHRQVRPLATLGVMKRDTSRALLFDEIDTLVGWENASKNSQIGTTISNAENKKLKRLGFSGIHVIGSEIFEYMSSLEGAFSIIDAYMLAISKGAVIRGADLGDNYWLDMGTPERLQELNERLSRAQHDS